MSNATPWLRLADAKTRCVRAGLGRDLLSEILKSGRVRVRGKRSGYGPADPIEDLLRRADQTRYDRGFISILWIANEIMLALDWSSPEHQRIAADLCKRDRWRGPAVPGMLEWPITFSDVMVHWPELVEELQAAGHEISIESGLPSTPRRRRKTKVLQRASDREIDKAITQVYDSKSDVGEKPPNLKEIVAPTQAILCQSGYEASGNRIQQLAGKPQHGERRRKPGVTVASEKRRRKG